MPKTLDPFRFLLFAVAGWMNQQQQHAIEYLREENRILRVQLGSRRLRFTDDQLRPHVNFGAETAEATLLPGPPRSKSAPQIRPDFAGNPPRQPTLHLGAT